MTRDLADTVKALAEKAAIHIDANVPTRLITLRAQSIAADIEPAIRELIAQATADALEAAARVGHKVVFEFLGMHRDQRVYSWHDIEDALTEGTKAIRALIPADIAVKAKKHEDELSAEILNQNSVIKRIEAENAALRSQSKEHDAKIRREAYLRCAAKMDEYHNIGAPELMASIFEKWANKPPSGGKADGGG